MSIAVAAGTFGVDSDWARSGRQRGGSLTEGGGRGDDGREPVAGLEQHGDRRGVVLDSRMVGIGHGVTVRGASVS